MIGHGACAVIWMVFILPTSLNGTKIELIDQLEKEGPDKESGSHERLTRYLMITPVNDEAMSSFCYTLREVLSV